MKQQKILIEYLYKTDKLVAKLVSHKFDGIRAEVHKVKGEPYGVVVAIGPSIMGWSLCNKLDKFDKSKALELAINRAKLISYVDSFDLENLYTNEVPFTLSDLILKMNDRSIKYFKDDFNDIPFTL